MPERKPRLPGDHLVVVANGLRKRLDDFGAGFQEQFGLLIFERAQRASGGRLGGDESLAQHDFFQLRRARHGPLLAEVIGGEQSRFRIGEFAKREARLLGYLGVLIKTGRDQRLNYRRTAARDVCQAFGAQCAQRFDFNRSGGYPLPPADQRSKIGLSRRSPDGADRVNAALLGKLAYRFKRDGAHAPVFAARHGSGQRADRY